MKRSAIFCTAARPLSYLAVAVALVLTVPLMAAKAWSGNPVAIVEYVTNSQTPLRPRQLLKEGQEILLGENGFLQIAFPRQCFTETIHGGVVVLHQDGGIVTGAKSHQRQQGNCQNPTIKNESGDTLNATLLSFRNMTAKKDHKKEQEVPPSCLTTTRPAFYADGSAKVAILRDGITGMAIRQYALQPGVEMLLDVGIPLQPGGVYLLERDQASKEFQLCEDAGANAQSLLNSVIWY